MPSTLPTHPLAVLPLKLWRPRWFDGVALVAGAAAPDVVYALDGIPIPSTHTVAGVLWWGLPVTLLTAWLLRLGAPAVAAHLPGAARDYGVLGRVRHPWPVVVTSALLGVVSHLLWDLVTHPGGPVGSAWWQVRQVSDASSLLLTPLFIWYAARRRLLHTWHGPAPRTPRRPARFWSVAVAVGAAGTAVTCLLGYPGPHVFIVRLIVTAMVALLAAAAAVRMPAP